MVQFYYQPWNDVQRIYYEFHRQNGRGATILPFINRTSHRYLSQYILLNEFHRRLHPFQFLKSGDHAMMVGIHEGFINLGYSTLFVMSALVGEKGHIWAVDPDERNITAIEEFCRINMVSNVTTLQKAVYREKKQLEFVRFSDFSSSNMAKDQFDRKQQIHKELWGEERRERETEVITVEADTVDNLIRDQIKEPVRFLNLTINGTEGDALAGAHSFMAQPEVEIAFPMQNLEDPLYEILEHQGFSVAVADAPTKAWDPKQFLYGLATHRSSVELKAIGFSPAQITNDQSAANEFCVALK